MATRIHQVVKFRVKKTSTNNPTKECPTCRGTGRVKR